uniref:E7 n=1 Tax=Bovine papillomavirus TaxID=10571 RepID=A3QMF1_9PAPI|nr:E7 [Bovine papillomavirus]
MVAGPACTKHLPKDGEPIGGITLLLSRTDNNCDAATPDSDFSTLHAAFKPVENYCPQPAPCQVLRERASLHCGIFFVTLQCPCTFPLRVAVQATHGNIRDFQELLTRATFDLLCPRCASRHYGK